MSDVDLDPMRPGRRKAERFIIAKCIPFGVRNADIGTGVNCAPDQLWAGFIIACHRKIRRKTVGQNVPQPITVAFLAMAMQLGRKDGYELFAVMALHVDNRLRAKSGVRPVMFRQAGEVISGLSR